MDDSPQQRCHGLSERDVHTMLTTLTLIRAHAQMVQRWLIQHNHAEAEPTLERLALLDRLVMQLVVDIDSQQIPDDESGER